MKRGMSHLIVPRRLAILLIGDAITLGAVTLVGLGVHHELGRVGERLWPTFLPLWVGWLLIAPQMQLYDLSRVTQPVNLWRPIWAMILAAPFGLWLRGYWLGTAIIPVFVLIMGGISALAIFAWRFLFLAFTSRRSNA